MTNPSSKPSAGSAISSEDKLFLLAKLKLSALYTAVVFLLLATLSGLLYYELVINVTDSFGDQLVFGSPQEHALEETLSRLRMNIITTDMILLIVVAVLSYALARHTLGPIRRSLEFQKRFAADASHELRTPLTVMKSELEVALRGAALKPAEVQAMFSSALEEVEHMTALTEQLLFLSRGGTQVQTQLLTVDFSGLTERTARKIAPLAAAKNLTLGFDVETDVRIAGNGRELERVLYNLIQNAISYTDAGSVRVTLRHSGAEAVLVVEDTGMGIEAAQQPLIFDRFYKADAAREAGKSGAGLGLAIVREIVVRHGGTIAVESEPGRGSRFTARFTAI